MGAFPAQPVGRQKARGFTLIELMVVVAVVGVLLAILVPTLSGARRSAQHTVSGERARQCSLAILEVVQRNDQFFPIAEVAPNSGSFYGIPNRGVPRPDGTWAFMAWFGQEQTWARIIHYYFDYALHPDVFRSPTSASPRPKGVTFEELLLISDYEVTEALLATPGFFEDDMQHPVLCKNQRVSIVRSPARKVLMLENASSAKRRSAHVRDDPSTSVDEVELLVLRPVTFFDGHVEKRKLSEAGAFRPNDLWFRKPTACYMTKRGLWGHDF